MGVAVSVNTCTSASELFSCSLWRRQNAVLIDDQEAEIAESDGLGEQRVGTDEISTSPVESAP